jgi:regulator of protease activity HflC (stomatin/prohibitin superfamily)
MTREDNIMWDVVALVFMYTLWIILIGGGSLGLILCIGGFLSLTISWFGVMLIGIALLVATGIKFIPSKDPASKGYLEIFGKKTNVIINEGIVLVCTRLGLNVVAIPVEKQNIDIPYKNVRCRANVGGGSDADPVSGGAVTISFGIVYRVARFKEYIDAGGTKENITNIIHDALYEDIRQTAESMTWEEMTFAGSLISLKVLNKLVGNNLPELEEIEEIDSITKNEANKKISAVIRSISEKGVNDRLNLGIIIEQFNMKDVVPEGDLLKDAELLARERQQAHAIDLESETIEKTAKRYISEGVDPTTAHMMALKQQGKSVNMTHVSTDTGGTSKKNKKSDDSLAQAAILAEGLRGRNE